MSQAVSPTTGHSYGIQRVCSTWDMARSSFYWAGEKARREATGYRPQKRGPKTLLTDDALLELIRADLADSPFQGEGHRKVWARLRVQKQVRTSRKRLLRIMRDNRLLSPHRGRVARMQAHDGTIVTQRPNLMWGTDGVRIFTVEQGWVWLFTAVEHWNAECVGWHVVKVGNRYAALEPIAQGLNRIFGGGGADAARGLKLRMDHGTQYLSDHFQNQLKFWGITPSFAFVEEPQTNGVVERFNRTLKEQIVYGRIYKDAEELRAAVAAFMDLYNRHWMLEKLDFQSPAQARASHAALLENGSPGECPGVSQYRSGSRSFNVGPPGEDFFLPESLKSEKTTSPGGSLT